MSEAVIHSGKTLGYRRRKRPSTREEMTPLMYLFWTLVSVFGVYSLITAPSRPFYFTMAAWIAGFGCFYCLYLWCGRKVPGLPLFPVYAFTFIPTHALQFLLAEPRLQEHSAGAIWRAAL